MTWLERICAAHERSERAAVIGERGSVIGRELIGKSVTAADLLVELDVQPGQPIPGLLTTNADALGLLFGGAAANRPLAPLGPRQTTAELAETVHRSGSPILLAEPAFARTAREVADAVGIRAVTISALPEAARPLRSESGSTAVYLHTAGTTGFPKVVPLTEQVLDARRPPVASDWHRPRRPLCHRLTAASHRRLGQRASGPHGRGGGYPHHQILLRLVAQPETT